MSKIKNLQRKNQHFLYKINMKTEETMQRKKFEKFGFIEKLVISSNNVKIDNNLMLLKNKK